MSLQENELAGLLQRYGDGSASEEERLLLEQWYQQLDVSGGQVWASAAQEQETKDKLYGMILHQADDVVVPGGRRMVLHNVFRIAAVLLLAVSLVWLLRLPGRGPSAVNVAHSVRRNEVARPEQPVASSVHLLVARSGRKALTSVRLADGSTAWLNAGSVLKYPDRFEGGGRAVEVAAGEVFFTVVRDGLHPFRVQTGSVITTVLGTSFLVKQSFEKNTVEVSVRTGAVKVEKMDRYGAGTLVGRSLLPGDQLRFDTIANMYQLKKIAVNGIAAFLQGRLVYEDARLEEIVYDITRKYGVSIRFDNDKLKDLRYRISFDDMPLTDALQVLGTLTGTRIEKGDKGGFTIK